MSPNEVSYIATATEMEPGYNDLTGLRYKRACILADADVDGSQIAKLLNALFYRHFRPLMENELLCIAVPHRFESIMERMSITRPCAGSETQGGETDLET